MDNHFPLLVRVPHRPEGFDMPLEVMVARLERMERVTKATYQVICLTPGASGSKQSAGTTQHPAAKNVLARRSGKACSTPLEFHHECHPLPRSAFETAPSQARGWRVSSSFPRNSACPHPSLPVPDPAHDATRKKQIPFRQS